MPLSQLLFRCARAIYRRTPVRAVRRLYYQSFTRIVRRRVIRSTIDGAQFQLDLGETIDLTMLLGEFEKDVRAEIVKRCKPGMVVVDVGANIGAHTLLFATVVTPGGKVIAFEPTEYAFGKLQRNVALNPTLNITLVHLALSETAGPPRKVDFRASWPTSGPRRDGESTVAFGTLDSWCERNGLERIDLMKIDVDGNEYGVLRGAEFTLARCRPTILMEVVGPHLDDDSRNPLRLLEKQGYVFRDIRTGNQITIEEMRPRFPHGDTKMTTSMNVVAELPA
jgi:FkbM family methyltransferase